MEEAREGTQIIDENPKLSGPENKKKNTEMLKRMSLIGEGSM